MVIGSAPVRSFLRRPVSIYIIGTLLAVQVLKTMPKNRKHDARPKNFSDLGVELRSGLTPEQVSAFTITMGHGHLQQ